MKHHYQHRVTQDTTTLLPDVTTLSLWDVVTADAVRTPAIVWQAETVGLEIDGVDVYLQWEPDDTILKYCFEFGWRCQPAEHSDVVDVTGCYAVIASHVKRVMRDTAEQ